MRYACTFLCVALVLMLHGPVKAQEDQFMARADDRPVLVFTTFPQGVGELFHRILEEAYDRLGYAVRVKGLPAQRALAMSDSGEVDGEAGRVPVIEAQCPNLLRVPTPIYTNTFVVITKRDDIDTSRGWEELAPYRLGVAIGYKFIEKQTASMHRMLFPGYDRMLAMVENERLDAAVCAYMDVLPSLGNMDLSQVHVLEPPLGHAKMYHYLHKKHADLVPRIDRVLQQMAREGRIQAIQKELEAQYLTATRNCREDCALSRR